MSFAPQAALAQPAADEEPQAGGLEEIVVTAQRREERLQDVPITVSAVTAAALTRQGVQATADLNTAIPGLNMTRGAGSVLPFLRGIGTSASSVGNDPSVSVYIDGVYQSFTPGLAFSFNNIERIEVLKGPQGTLFGRNATGGLINIVTRDPEEGLSGRASIGYANYDTVQTNAYLTAGNEVIKADIAVLYNKQMDGWGRNLFTPDQASPTGTVTTGTGEVVPVPGVPKHVGYAEEFAVRSKILLTPGDTTQIRLTGDYFKTDGEQGFYRSILPGTLASPDPTGTPAQQDAARVYRHEGGFYDYNSDIPWALTTEGAGGALRIDQELGFANLMTLTSYRYSEGVQGRILSEVTPIITQNNATQHQEVKTFTQEIQLLSNPGDSFTWIIGAFYLDSTAMNDTIEFSRGQIEPSFARFARQKTESIAGFAQGTYEIFSNTRLTLGARYTEDRLRADGYDIGRRLGAVPSPVFADGVISQTVEPQRTKASKLTYRASLDHKFTPDIMGYLSYSRGFKSGAYPTAGLCAGSATTSTGGVNTICTSPSRPARPEVLDAFEAGIKSDLFDRKVRFNASAFFYKYDDLQVQQVLNINGLPVSLVANAAKAELYGLDVESVVVPIENLQLNFGLTLLHTEYTDFPNAVVFVPNATPEFPNRPNDAQVVIPNARGNKLNRAPKSTFSAGFSYAIPSEVGRFTLDGSYYYNDGFFWEAGNRLRQKSYSLVNAQIGWWDSSERYGLRLWGKNLTGTKYYAFQQAAGSSGDQGAPAAPRTYGVALDIRF